MRSFALCSLVLLTLSACKIEDPFDTLTSITAALTDSSATDVTASGTSGTSGEDPTSGTTGETPTTGMTGTSATGSTGEPATSTTGMTGMTSMTGSTGEPGSTGGGTTGGAGDYPYPDCSNQMGMEVACPQGLLCIDEVNTQGAVKGAFCSPACSGPGMLCPTPDGVQGVNGTCLFGADPNMPTQCALVCNLAMDTCPEGTACEDIGLPEQMGMKFGICTFM